MQTIIRSLTSVKREYECSANGLVGINETCLYFSGERLSELELRLDDESDDDDLLNLRRQSVSLLSRALWKEVTC